MSLFIPITKVDVAKRLVYGILSEEIADKSDEILDYATAKPAFQKWSEDFHAASGGKSLGNIRAMHGSVAAGKLTDLKFDDDAKRVEGCAKIIDDAEWNKVVEGVYTGFSIGGGYAKRWPDKANPKLMRYTPTLSEVSIVDNPCVPTATFEYVKADGSVELRKFNHQSQEDIMNPKTGGAAATSTDEQALFKAAEDAVAAGTATDEQKALLVKRDADAQPVLVKDGKAVKPKIAPVQLHKWIAADGSHHDSKRDAEIHNLGIEKTAELAPALSAMEDILAKAKKPVDEDEDAEGDDEETAKAKKVRREKKAKDKEDADKVAREKAEKDEADAAAKAKEKDDAEKASGVTDLVKKKYTEKEREEMAAKGEAMEGGGFPIKDKEDLKNAIKAYGRAKDKDAAKKHIIARAKALKLTDELPADWEGSTKKKETDKSAKSTGLAKGLHQVGWLANLLMGLQEFQNSVAYEQLREGDKDSELPAKLKSLVSEACDILVTLVEEETDELTDGDETDVIILEMAAGLPIGHPALIAKAMLAKAAPLAKSDSKKDVAKGERFASLAAIMEKAGARHSKADMERLQSVHDGLDEMHKCMGDMVEKCADMHKAAGMMKNTAIDMGAEGQHVEPDDEEDGRGANKAAKAFAALNAKSDEVLAITKLAASQNETLLKAIAHIGDLKKDSEILREEKEGLAKRVDHLEKQPAAAKGHVRAISKTQDAGGNDSASPENVIEAFKKLSKDQQTMVLIKASLSAPVEHSA